MSVASGADRRGGADRLGWDDWLDRADKGVAGDGVPRYGGLMLRIVLIMALFILLMNGPHGGTALPASFASITVSARALPAVPAAEAARFGPLRLLDAWQLTSPHPAFGGISSLIADDDGGLTALSDSGETFSFRVAPDGAGVLRPLPRFDAERDVPKWRWDSESMVRDPASGRIWVGFEHLQRICRYAPGFARIEGCVSPPEVRRWPLTGSLEALIRFGDGRFMAIAEMARHADGAHDVLLWPGDPVDRATPPPVRLGYRPPPGYRPTDALWLGGDRLLVLNRRLTLAQGFTAKLALVRLPALTAGAQLDAEVVATFAPPGLADNFEALALSYERRPGSDERGRGRPILWLASDNNHLFLQRNLLLRFALPENWVSDRPVP